VSWDSTPDLNGERTTLRWPGRRHHYFDEIRDEADYTVPRGVADEMAELLGTTARE
jgi:hypothetical protein